MELKRYFKVILRWWWLIVVSLVIVTIASFIFSFSQPPVYQSTTTLVVSPKATIGDVSTVRQSLDTLDKATIINTYAEVIRSRQIYDQAQVSLNLAVGDRGSVEILANGVQKTNLIVIEAQGSNPLLVYNMANAVAEKAINYINDLYEVYDVKVLDAAQPPVIPISPNVLRDTALGALLGLLLGVCVAFLADYIRKPMETQERLSIIDADSGLYNKRYFLQRLYEEINRSKRNQRPLAICLVSLNDLSSAEHDQDKATHKAIFRQVSNYLKHQMRQGEILARWAGERMAWLMLDASEDVAHKAVKRVRSKLEQGVFEDEESGERFFFNGNFGVVVFSDSITESELMSVAEQALGEAELNGAGGVVIKSASELK